MATTPNFSIPLYTTADNARLDTLLNGQATALDTNLKTAIDSIPKNYRVGTDAQRLALSGISLYEGLRFYCTDTNREWLYDGTVWLSNDSGRYLITPTSVSGTGLSISNGEVVASAMPATGGNLESVFSSRFRHYEIEVEGTFATSAAFQIRLRNSGGTANGATDYLNQYIYATASGSVSSVQNNLSLFSVSATLGDRITAHLRLTNPAAAVATGYLASSSSRVFNSVTQTQMGGFHNPSVAYTALEVTTSGGAFTGTVKVYGVA